MTLKLGSTTRRDLLKASAVATAGLALGSVLLRRKRAPALRTAEVLHSCLPTLGWRGVPFEQLRAGQVRAYPPHQSRAPGCVWANPQGNGDA